MFHEGMNPPWLQIKRYDSQKLRTNPGKLLGRTKSRKILLNSVVSQNCKNWKINILAWFRLIL
jgi:hypothetical protein